MPQLSNTFEGGTNGVQLTPGSGGNTGGASGDYFTNTPVPSDGILKFTNARVFAGSLALQLATRTVSGSCAVYWGPAVRGTLITDDYIRFYLYADDITTGGAAKNIVRWFANGGATSLGGILLGNNRLYVTDQGNAVVTAQSTALMVAGQWVRIEAHLHPRTDGTGSIQIKLFLDPTSTTPDWDYTLSGITSPFGYSDQIYFGNAAPGANWPSATGSFYFDAIVTGAATWVGPVSAPRGIVPAGISATSTVSGAIRRKGTIQGPGVIHATSTVSGSVGRIAAGTSVGDFTLPYYGEGAYGEASYDTIHAPPGGGGGGGTGGGGGGSGGVTPGQPTIVPPSTPTGDAIVDFVESSPPGLLPENEESTFGFVIRGIWAAKIEDLIGEQDMLYAERFIPTSQQFLDEWERQTGTPANPGGFNTQSRRAIIQGRIRKGPFTRTKRKEIVERYLSATFAGGIALTPEGLSLTSAGISLASTTAPTNLSTVYKIVEDIPNFRYHVYILNAYTPSAGLANELARITPSGISFDINFVSVLP
jgi:hypothetical protein